MRSEDSPRIGAPAVYLFNAFFVVASAKTHPKNPPKPHPLVFLFFHMGKHAYQIYRDFMKISSFENVFLVLFQHVDAVWCSFRPSILLQCVEKKILPKRPPLILRVKINSRVGHRRKSYIMGKHAYQIYRDFMKISSFENVFLVLFQHVDAVWCCLKN